jgi:tyrosyl-tRNA synthetase
MGGDDQWGNILAGVDLIRRVDGATTYAVTFPLLTTASGAKMGKTAAGAIWLDPEMLSPYEFYQYWVNCDDRDVERFLKLFTFLPLDEITRLTSVQDADIRRAKQILAYEATSITHGEAAAHEALAASQALFGGGGDLASIPTTGIPAQSLASGIPLAVVMADVGLATSRGEARRTIQQGGAYVNGRRIGDVDYVVTAADVAADGIILRAGKKRHHRLVST